jgi:hypothetical protein
MSEDIANYEANINSLYELDLDDGGEDNEWLWFFIKQ